MNCDNTTNSDLIKTAQKRNLELFLSTATESHVLKPVSCFTESPRVSKPGIVLKEISMQVPVHAVKKETDIGDSSLIVLNKMSESVENTVAAESETRTCNDDVGANDLQQVAVKNNCSSLVAASSCPRRTKASSYRPCQPRTCEASGCSTSVCIVTPEPRLGACSGKTRRGCGTNNTFSRCSRSAGASNSANSVAIGTCVKVKAIQDKYRPAGQSEVQHFTAIVMYESDDGHYKLGTRKGILGRMFSRDELIFTPKVGMTLKDVPERTVSMLEASTMSY
ncbi:uncharacterized protein LOC131941696 [Physella acuta]|uniref:uncharacterized protein LOC131941696 n=1 Tax=Physella acuta TaxID=109671 RepID=UPI0027DC068B|nr:uncharacterized protein LOC131941696 [Physella acuta]